MLYAAVRYLLSVLVPVLGAVSLLGNAVPCQARPQLRMETGVHRGAIFAVSSDGNGHHLVSVGSDLSVRIWDGLRGAALKTLYPVAAAPASPGILRAGLSADGQLLAVAVADESAGQPGRSQILLREWRTDRDRGTLRLDAPVHRILWSPHTGTAPGAAAGDNRLAVLSAAGVVTVYAPNELNTVAELTCPGSCIDIDYSRSGRLLTLSATGQLSLYDGELRMIRQSTRPEKARYARVAPDGSRILVSAADVGQLEVLDAQDLQPRYRLDMRSLDGQAATAVAWSSDGGALYAGVSAAAPARYLLRRWVAAEKGNWVDMAMSSAAISALSALPQEGVAYATTQSVLGAVAANQKPLWQKRNPLPDFSESASPVLVDVSGTHVRFSLTPKSWISFSTRDHSLIKGKGPLLQYLPPRTEAAGWALQGWPVTPHIGDVAIPLEQTERIRCRAFTPPAEAQTAEQKTLLLGTDRALAAYDRAGKARWRVVIPGGVAALNVSGNGQLAVAGLADGSLRWYAAEDGRELLGLLVDQSGDRWAAFTPGGYYEAEGGGEELFGFLVVSSRDFADFFRAAVFRERRFRPDVVRRALSTRDDRRAVGELNAERGTAESYEPIESLIPPVVTILDPQDGATASASQLSLRVAVRAPAASGLVRLRTVLAGRYSQSRGLRLTGPPEPPPAGEESIYEVPVEVSPEESTITVIASMGELKSEPASVRIIGTGNPASATRAKPNLYVLAIGVANYQQEDLRLRYPAKDARDLIAILREHGKGLYERVLVRELTDHNATRDNILAGLGWLRDQPTRSDVAVLFLAGHGISDSATGNYFFLPYDADLTSDRSTLVDAGQIHSSLTSTHGRVLLLLDTCHSGNVLGSRRDDTAFSFSRMVSQMASADSGVVVYAATAGAQASQESARWKNGAFTKAVIEGLRGSADYAASGRVTVSELEHYVGQRVRQLTQEAQTPTTAKPTTIADFPLVLVAPRRVLVKKAWFWTALGFAAAGAATAIGLGVYAGGPNIGGLPTLRPFGG